MLDIASGNGWVLLTALAAGAIGGFGAALLLLDPTESSTAAPVGKTAAKVVAIRTLVGAIAAAAFLFFFPVEQQTVASSGGHVVVTTVYPFLKVIALTLVVGTGGSAFLSAMRNQAESFITASNAQKATAEVKATSIAALNLLPTIAGQSAELSAQQQVDGAKAAASRQIDSAAGGLPPQVRQLPPEPANTVTHAFASALGIDESEITTADPESEKAAFATAADAIPTEVHTSVLSELQSHVNDVIAEITNLG